MVFFYQHGFFTCSSRRRRPRDSSDKTTSSDVTRLKYVRQNVTVAAADDVIYPALLFEDRLLGRGEEGGEAGSSVTHLCGRCSQPEAWTTRPLDRPTAAAAANQFSDFESSEEQFSRRGVHLLRPSLSSSSQGRYEGRTDALADSGTLYVAQDHQ